MATNAGMSRRHSDCPLYQHPRTHPPLRRGRACPARALSITTRYCFTHPVSPLHRREGSCPLRGASRTPPPTGMTRHPPHTPTRPRRPEGRTPYDLPFPQPVGEGFIPPVPLPVVLHLTIHSVGAAYMPPATFPPPAVNLPPPTNPIICVHPPPSPQYTPCPNFSLKLCRKNQKNLQKPVDKGHTTCYNNQAVSRAQPAAAAAEAFTYSVYAVF